MVLVLVALVRVVHVRVVLVIVAFVHHVHVPGLVPVVLMRVTLMHVVHVRVVFVLVALMHVVVGHVNLRSDTALPQYQYELRLR